MILRIYLNALNGEPFETHDLAGYATLREWMTAKVKGYDPQRAVPLEAFEGERPLDLDAPLTGVDVSIVMRPRGTDPFSITAALFKGAQAAFRALMPKIPGTPNAPGQGDSLSTSNARGNRVKLGDVIREVAGRMRIYPDFVVPSRSYFQNGTEQWVESLFCVGKGRFQIASGGIRIGETAIASLDTNASFRIYQPGESMVGDSRSDWWHSAEEVGASSTGNAGLELTASFAVTQNAQASTFQFSGTTITIPTGQGSFPTDWNVGQVVRVVAPYSFTVTDGGGANRDVITGPLAMVAAAVGDVIEVAGGANAGVYTVVTFNTGTGMTLDFQWGAPANSLTPGTGLASIGPNGLKYRITNVDTANRSFIQVERLTTAGATDPSWPGFNALTTSEGSVSLPPEQAVGGYRGPFPAVPEKELCTAFEVDIFFPNGLAQINTKGQTGSLTAQYVVEWRDMAVGGAYTVVTYSRTGSSQDQQGFTERVNLPYPMRPEVRVRRIAAPTSANTLLDTMQWFGLKGRIDRVPRSYAGVTCLAVSLRSSDRIANQSENLISVEGTRILPYRASGVWQTAAPTRDITAFAAYLVKSLGYTDAQLNLSEFDALQAIWTARGETFDAAITDSATAKKVLLDIFGAGMGEYTMDRGQIRPVRDGLRSQYEGGYSPQSHTRSVVQNVQFPSPDDFDGVEVTYVNRDTWQQDTVTYLLPGDSGSHVEKITAVGVTDRTRAWRIGARRRRSQAFRRRTFKWSNEYDGRINRYLSYVLLSDDVPGFGQSALMRGASVSAGVTTFVVTEKFVWDSGTNVVAVRRPNGTMWGPFTATRVDDYTLSVAATIDFAPVFDGSIEPPHVMFGGVERFAYPVLLTSIKPNGMASTDMQAVGYDARVYADDDNSPP